MASIYDIARIASGDPMERVSDRAKEADVLFNQYERQKEIVNEINEAIAEAKRKQKKNKFGYNLLGSLLGAGGGALLGNIAGANKIIAGGLQALGGGLGSGVAEKLRQDRSGATDKLKEIERKYKGRKEAKDATEARETFEAEQDAMLQTDVISGALANLIAPIKKTTQTMQYGVTDAPIASGEKLLESIGETLEMPNNQITNLAGVTIDTPIMEALGSSEAIANFTPALDTGFEESVVSKLNLGINKKMAEAILGIPQEALEGLDNNILTGLLRALGPQAYGQITTPKPIVEPLYAPQFRNPYGGF